MGSRVNSPRLHRLPLLPCGLEDSLADEEIE